MEQVVVRWLRRPGSTATRFWTRRWRRRSARAGLLACAALAVGAGGAWARDAGPRPCHDEAERRCAYVRGENDRERCIIQREMACEQEREGKQSDARRGARELRRVCRSDFEDLCQHVGSGGSRDQVIRCLEEHRALLSGPCGSALDALPRAGNGAPQTSGR